MTATRKIHTDKGYDHDPKYSKWRRERFPELSKIMNAYCMDVDWLEWRQGHPVAFLECRRAIGSLNTAEEVLEHYKKLNNGFQFEALARLALDAGIKSYIVAIEDSDLESADYKNARFLVERVHPPKKNSSGKINIKDITTVRKEMNEQEYVEFIANLKR